MTFAPAAIAAALDLSMPSPRLSSFDKPAKRALKDCQQAAPARRLRLTAGYSDLHLPV